MRLHEEVKLWETLWDKESLAEAKADKPTPEDYFAAITKSKEAIYAFIEKLLAPAVKGRARFDISSSYHTVLTKNTNADIINIGHNIHVNYEAFLKKLASFDITKNKLKSLIMDSDAQRTVSMAKKAKRRAGSSVVLKAARMSAEEYFDEITNSREAIEAFIKDALAPYVAAKARHDISSSYYNAIAKNTSDTVVSAMHKPYCSYSAFRKKLSEYSIDTAELQLLLGIDKVIKESVEELDQFFNKETGKRLYLADDDEGGGIIAAVWAKSDGDAMNFIWDYAYEFSERAHIMTGSEYYDSFEDFVEDFPDLADGEGGEVCDGFDRDPDRYWDARYDSAFAAIGESASATAVNFADEFKLHENLWNNLNEWVPASGKTASNAPTVTADGKLDQTNRYKSLLAQLDTDNNVTYVVKDLSERVLYVHTELQGKVITARIVAHLRRTEYTLQLGQDAASKGDFKNLSWEAVLKHLLDEGIITSTSLCD